MKKIIFVATFLLGLLTVRYSFAQSEAALPAETILAHAEKQAASTHKKVFLLYHASWCKWCHVMDTLMSKPEVKAFFDKNYVITHLSVMENGDNVKLENPGAAALLEKMGGADSGIPYWVILDDKGAVLANSRLKSASEPLTGVNGDNTGCPIDAAGRSYFLTVLSKTSSMTPAQLKIVEKVFSPKM